MSDEVQTAGSFTVESSTLKLATAPVSDSASLPGRSEGTSVAVKLSHFIVMEVLDKRRGPSGDEYIVILKSSWPADQAERMKTGRRGI